MSPEPTKPELRPVRAVLAALRSRLRTVRIARAGGWILGAIAAALVVSFALDRLVDLPLAVRVVHLAAVAVGVFALATWATRPLRARVSDGDLAQALEDVVPQLGDRVASALDFEKRLDDPHENESRAMMRIVVRQAAAMVQKVQPKSLIDVRPLRRVAAGAATAVIALTLVAAIWPADFGLWVRRGLLLQDVDWPRRTTMRVLDFATDGATVVTHGQDLQITAQADGRVPREVLLHYEALEFPGDDAEPVVTESDVRRMFAIEDEQGATGRFAFQFRSISSSFRFWVTGGDDDDARPVFVVRAMIPPRVSSLTARITYPEHSGLPPAVVREMNFEVLRGSRVELSLVANMPLASASIVPDDDDTGGGIAARDLAIAGENQDTLALGIDVHEDVRFHLALTAATGQANREEDDRFLIRALSDRAPDVRMLFPLGRLYRTPTGLVPVKAFVQDDFGLSSVDLDLALADRASTSRLWELAPDAGATLRADVYRPVEVADLGAGADAPVRAGDLLRVSLRGTDNAGQETTATETTVEILAPEDLERRLAQKQVGLRDQLTQLRSHHRRTHDALRRLRTGLGERDAQPEDFDEGRDLQVEQGRITGELSQFLRGIHRVFDAYVLNRLGGIPAIDRILPLYHAALAAPSDDSESAFPRSLYTQIVEGKRAKRIYDPEIIGTLLDIMDLADTCEVDSSPAVYDALRTWADGGADADLLDEAERRSDELAERLRELDRRMDRWEAMSELIELARQVRNRQDDIAKPVDESLGGDHDGR